MVNYMEDVAKLLGVQIGEYFEIKGDANTYVLLGDGLHNVNGKYLAEMTLMRLLAGKAAIKRKPWKPKFEEVYYSIGVDGDVEDGVWLSDFIDYSLYKLGNCYKTTEEAAVDRGKWRAFYDSDEVLEV